MALKLSHLDVCNAVTMTGSVTGAAKLLHLSQPAVSKLLQSAENQLGFKLFLREKNKLVPTAEALQLQPEFMAIAQRLARLREFSTQLASRPGHILRVACAPSIAAALIGPAAQLFAQQFPQVHCEIETHVHDHIVQRLVQGQCDVGLSLAALAHPALVEEVIATGAMVVAVPRVWMGAAPASLALQDLARWPVVRVPPGGPLDAPVLPLAPASDAVTPRFTVSTHVMALRLAEQGLGVAAIDSFTAAMADRGSVHLVPLLPDIAVRIHHWRAQGRPASHPGRGFVQAVAQAARQAHGQCRP